MKRKRVLDSGFEDLDVGERPARIGEPVHMGIGSNGNAVAC